MGRPESLEPESVALLATGTVVVGSLALTEAFATLLLALPAYAGAWWVLGLDRHPTRSREPR